MSIELPRTPQCQPGFLKRYNIPLSVRPSHQITIQACLPHAFSLERRQHRQGYRGGGLMLGKILVSTAQTRLQPSAK